MGPSACNNKKKKLHLITSPPPAFIEMKLITVNPLLSPPGAYLFQAHLRGGLNRDGGGLFDRGAYLI